MVEDLAVLVEVIATELDCTIRYEYPKGTTPSRQHEPFLDNHGFYPLPNYILLSPNSASDTIVKLNTVNIRHYEQVLAPDYEVNNLIFVPIPPEFCLPKRKGLGAKGNSNSSSSNDESSLNPFAYVKTRYKLKDYPIDTIIQNCLNKQAHGTRKLYEPIRSKRCKKLKDDGFTVTEYSGE